MVSRWSLTAEAQFRCQVSPCEFYGGRSGNETGFFLGVLSFLSTHFCKQNKKLAKPWNSSKSNAISENGSFGEKSTFT